MEIENERWKEIEIDGTEIKRQMETREIGSQIETEMERQIATEIERWKEIERDGNRDREMKTLERWMEIDKWKEIVAGDGMVR